jgi:hypothetical protein
LRTGLPWFADGGWCYTFTRQYWRYCSCSVCQTKTAY